MKFEGPDQKSLTVNVTLTWGKTKRACTMSNDWDPKASEFVMSRIWNLRFGGRGLVHNVSEDSNLSQDNTLTLKVAGPGQLQARPPPETVLPLVWPTLRYRRYEFYKRQSLTDSLNPTLLKLTPSPKYSLVKFPQEEPKKVSLQGRI